MNKINALAKFLGVKKGDLKKESYDYYGLEIYSSGSEEYAIGTDEEANEACRENIKQSVWAFNKSFLNAHSEAINEIDDKSYAKLQEGCESINNAVLKMIDDFDYFVDTAIYIDGRGHFLSGYDGKEQESEGYYIYRIN